MLCYTVLKPLGATAEPQTSAERRADLPGIRIPCLKARVANRGCKDNGKVTSAPLVVTNGENLLGRSGDLRLGGLLSAIPDSVEEQARN